MSKVKITREEFVDFFLAYRNAGTSEEMQNIRDTFWSRIEALNAEVERLEGALAYSVLFDKEQSDKIYTLTAELDRLKSGEGMSMEEIETYLDKYGLIHTGATGQLAKLIQPLTRRQGFVVDAETWKKAPKDAVGIGWAFHDAVNAWIPDGDFKFHFIPRPAPKMRAKTVEQLCHEYAQWIEKGEGLASCGGYVKLAKLLATSTPENPVTIYTLCTAAGIELEVAE